MKISLYEKCMRKTYILKQKKKKNKVGKVNPLENRKRV